MQLPEPTARDNVEVAIRCGLLRVILDSHRIPDILKLGLGSNSVRLAISTQTAQQPARLVFATHLDEPSRRLGEEPAGAEEDEERDDLEGDGEAPDDCSVAVVDEGEAAGVGLVVASVSVGGMGTYNSSQYATTTPKMLRVNSMAMNWPRLVCSAVSVAQTGTMAFRIPVPTPLIRRAVWEVSVSSGGQIGGELCESRHTENHPGVVLGRALQGGAKNCPGSTKSNCLDSANLVSGPATHEGADQRAEIVDGDDAALEQAVCDDGGVLSIDDFGIPEAHGVDVVLGVVHSAHHSLIITKEEDGEGGETVDGDEELALLERMGNVPFLNLVAHGCGLRG